MFHAQIEKRVKQSEIEIFYLNFIKRRTDMGVSGRTVECLIENKRAFLASLVVTSNQPAVRQL